MLASPTVLLNAALSFLPDRGLVVRGPDSLAVVVPMFNEQAGAAAAVTSLLRQTEPLDEVVISINGGTDSTASRVRSTLGREGFVGGSSEPLPAFAAVVQRWQAPDSRTRVIVIDHHEPMSKADSVNVAVLSKLATARRILVVDGDTVLDQGFVAGMRDNFYRLRVVRERSAGGQVVKRHVLEDLALQSGSVRSQQPQGGGVIPRLVWLARSGEYAVSGLLRSGQTKRVGSSGPFARSRLFTVVGCGFVARRDTFPMPDDTRTEDHDFTLTVQSGEEITSLTSARALDQRGFRVVTGATGRDGSGEARGAAGVVGAAETSFSDLLGYDSEVKVVRGASARFVDAAVMYTEDPRHSGGLIRQLERWNGGAIENAHKRLATARARRGLRSNVTFAVVSALLENVLGLSLVLVLPALLGLRLGFDWSQQLLAGLGAWLAWDATFCLLLALLGLRRAAVHEPGAVAGARSRTPRWLALLTRAAVVALPLQLLRMVNAVSYVAAASRTLPALRRGRRSVTAPAPTVQPAPSAIGARRPSITWERPAAAVTPAVYRRTAGAALALAVVVVSVFFSTALVATSSVRPDRSAWQLIYQAPRVDMATHAALPMAPAQLAQLPPGPDQHAGLSPYCSPGDLRSASLVPRLVHGAGASAYQPLSPWGILVLARLAPLLTHLEEAATAYDLDADLLLRVLLNESYLDPLAVGPTEDLGLAQVTSDALTLLRSISFDTNSRFYNPALMSSGFSVFDPVFSLCAGAAKLAWAVAEPGGESDEVAYARYINPLSGVVRGKVADSHVELVAAMTALTPLTELLGSTIAAYRADPLAVTREERLLLDVADGVASGTLDVADAYRRTASLVTELQILDADLYQAVLDDLYGAALVSGSGAETILATLPEIRATSSSPSDP